MTFDPDNEVDFSGRSFLIVDDFNGMRTILRDILDLDRIEVLRDDGLPVRTVFDRLPPNLRARPTLSVTVARSDFEGGTP